MPEKFPEDFLFGSSTSPYQVEGNISGERVTDWDIYLQKHPEKNLNYPGEVGPNWWTFPVAERDFKRLADLGLNAQRLGFEWARIMPEQGRVDKNSIKRYREMNNCLLSLKMVPMWTLNHFTLPSWVAEFGGWENPQIVLEFKKYTEIMVYEFGDVKNWITINEPNQIIDMGYILGDWPPGKKFHFDKLPFLLKNLSAAHKNSYEVIKKNIPSSRIGVANAVKLLKPYNPNSVFDRKITDVANYLENNKLIDLSKDWVDFVGLNYYHSYLLKFKPTLKLILRDDAEGVVKTAPFLETVKPHGFVSDAGWSITPELFYELLLNIYKKYKKPIIVTENGIADRKDILGPFYMLAHLIAEEKAIKDGVKIDGHFHWSSIDTEEWMLGYKYDFGLIDLDQQTGKRKIRNRALLYSDIAKNRSIDIKKLSDQYLIKEQKDYINNLL